MFNNRFDVRIIFGRARKGGNYFEDLPHRDIDFADSISVLRIQEVRKPVYRTLRT